MPGAPRGAPRPPAGPPRRALHTKMRLDTMAERQQYMDVHCARMMVALPLAVPIPRPFIPAAPTRLNLFDGTHESVRLKY